LSNVANGRRGEAVASARASRIARQAMKRVRVGLAAGLALLTAAIVLTVLRSPMIVARTSGIASQRVSVSATRRGASYCQSRELVPQDTSAIRLWLGAVAAGPRVVVDVSSGGHVVTRGAHEAGWTGGAVTLPVEPLTEAIVNATVCVSFELHNEELEVFGVPAPPMFATRQDGRVLTGRMSVEYLRRGRTSWAAMALSIARRMGLGRAYAGTWIALLAFTLTGALAVSAVVLLLKELR
jgi:hypothetical protein